MSGGKGKDMEKTFWYKDAVIYQIWPRSFKDADGDGVGDLMGVYEKLDYLKSLHVDAIWFSPLYPSPNADFGYDVADYMDISAEYGGMAAFKKVLDGAHERGIRVIMDLVVNHTSDEHPWFQASRRGEEPYKDYYIWRKPKKDGTLPNNWDSMFEGKAWQYDEVRKAYYLHIFAIKQPDLNMDNPRVRAEVKKILRFWLDMGVDGFREDVITYISKPKGLPDAPFYMPMARGIFQYNNGPHLHEYLNEFRTVLDDYDCVTIGEAPLITTKRALDFIGGLFDEELCFVYADSVSELLGQPEPVYRGYSSTAQHRMLVIPEEHWAKALKLLYAEKFDWSRLVYDITYTSIGAAVVEDFYDENVVFLRFCFEKELLKKNPLDRQGRILRMVYLNQDLTNIGKNLFPELLDKFLAFYDRKGKTSLETMLKRWYTQLEKEYHNHIEG